MVILEIGFLLQILQSEMNALSTCNECVAKSTQLVENTSADYTNSAFLAETQSACLRYYIQKNIVNNIIL